MSGMNYLSGYGTGTSYTSQLYSASNSKYRAGVTGWKHKESSSSNSASSASGMSDASNEYVSNVKTFAVKMNDALASLSGKNKASIFDSLKATSSNEKAVTVNIKDQDKASAFGADNDGKKTLEVNRLAAKQRNSGTMLESSKINGMKKGGNSFAIEKDGKTYDFNVNVNTTDSNRTVQEKMAAAINSRDIGISASVVYNDKDKTSSLVLTGKETGADNAFEIKDTGESDVVTQTGASKVVTEASDAMYTLDGDLRFSSSNEVDLGDGVTATLNAKTSEELTVSVGEDTEEITNAVYDLVNGFNQLRETAKDANADSGAKALQDRLDSVTSAYGSALNRAGISINSDGYMQIDKEKLTKAIDNGQAESVFGKNSGLVSSLSTVASQAEKDPKRFLSFEARTGKETGAASDLNLDELAHETSFTSAQSMELMRWENVGMLFNALV